MPELPEVQTIVDSLRPHVVGRQIVRVEVRRADVLRPDGFDWRGVCGRSIVSIGRRGKKIVFTLDTAEWFVVHLGMTGRLTIQSIGVDFLPHTHFVLGIDEIELRFIDPRRFGGIGWLGRELSPDAGLGPEPIGLRSTSLARRLGRTRRVIKNALLDQAVIAGLGNIYVDESLHAAGIHPLIRASDLSPARVTTLNLAIKKILRKAIRHRGSTLRDYRDADGNGGGFQRLHRVYARAGKPCRECETPIERLVLGGRSTHFCPRCQRIEAT